MTFSIIVPIYNEEKYLDKCLESIASQSYKDYEVIMVCDDSTDNSNKIAKKYEKKYDNFKIIFESHTGLAKAKNIGLEQASGDFIIFLDGDDYIEKDLLQKLIDEGINNYDLIRYQVREVKNNGIIKEFPELPFESKNGVDAFNNIIKYHFIENSWTYAYKKSFWDKYGFKFIDGCIAEDYGLTPLIIAKANNVKSISYIGYNYIQRENSLMNNNDYDKKIKKMDDMLKQATYEKLELETIKGTENIINFLDDSLIYYSTRLKYKDYKKYNKILKKRGCFKHLKGTSFRNKIRCFLIKTNSYIFFNYIKRGS